MTDLARQLLSELMDVNMELNNTHYSITVKNALVEQYWKLRAELIDVMGEEKFRVFWEQGRQMFAPAD